MGVVFGLGLKQKQFARGGGHQKTFRAEDTYIPGEMLRSELCIFRAA